MHSITPRAYAQRGVTWCLFGNNWLSIHCVNEMLISQDNNVVIISYHTLVC